MRRIDRVTRHEALFLAFCNKSLRYPSMNSTALLVLLFSLAETL